MKSWNQYAYAWIFLNEIDRYEMFFYTIAVLTMQGRWYKRSQTRQNTIKFSHFVEIEIPVYKNFIFEVMSLFSFHTFSCFIFATELLVHKSECVKVQFMKREVDCVNGIQLMVFFSNVSDCSIAGIDKIPFKIIHSWWFSKKMTIKMISICIQNFFFQKKKKSMQLYLASEEF